MIKIITRYFDSAPRARSVAEALTYEHGVSERILRVFDTPDGLAERLKARDASPEAAEAYQARMQSGGGAVLLIRCDYRPLGVANIFRDVTEDHGAVDMGGLSEEVYIKESHRGASQGFASISVLTDHPRIFTRRREFDPNNRHMADWPIPLISRRKPFSDSAFPRHARMADWPIPLISRREPFTASIIPRHGRMANMFLPLISRRKPYTRSIIPRHGRMANMFLPLTIRRTPFDKTLIGRHTRMANWPFPLLINGKTGTNSLIPGGPRMANFPLPLISRRKPVTASIIPRHARMANFPLPLISRRKPFTGSVISRHGRMADMVLPLVVSHAGKKVGEDAPGVSLSKYLGVPTVIRR